MKTALKIFNFLGSQDLPSGLPAPVMFLDARKDVVTDGSNNVISWKSQVGDFEAVPTGVTGFNPMTYDGEYVIGTDTNNRILRVTGNFSFLHNGSGGTVYFLTSYTGNSGDGLRPLWSTKDASSSSAGLWLYVDDAPEQENLSIDMGNGSTVNYYGSAAKAGNYSGIPDLDTIYTYRHDSANDAELFTDETKHGALSINSNVYGGTSSDFTIGGIQGAGFTTDQKVKAILIYEQRHTDEQAAEVRKWLSQRFRRQSELAGVIRTQSVIQTTDDPQAAMTAVGDVSRDSMHRFLFLDGTHDVVQLKNGSNHIIQGQSRSGTIIDMLQPDTTSATDISARSTLEMKKPMVAKDVTFRAQNARYPWHPEVNNSIDRVHIYCENCTIEHLGNPSGNNTWPVRSQVAVGSGTRSGTYIKFKNCEFKAPERVFSTHNNVDFTDNSVYELVGCTFTTTSGAASQNVAMSASTIVGSEISKKDVLKITDCTALGGLEAVYNSTGYNLIPAKAKAVTDYRFDITGTDLWWIGNDSSSSLRFRQEVIKIESTDTADTTSVTITGDQTIFGNSFTGGVESKALGNGLASYAQGTFDVNDFYDADNSLGSRLGDKTGKPVSFIVTQGVDSETVTLNDDYSAMTNAEVLTEINGQLSGFSASLIKPMDSYYPTIPDTMVTVKNVGTKAVGHGYGIRLLNSDNECRIATSTDEDDIAIAVDEIPVGQTGRVVMLSKISHFNLYKDFTALPTDGDKIGIGTTDGQFTYNPPNYVSLVADGTNGYTILDTFETVMV